MNMKMQMNMTQTKQTTSECKHYIPFCSGCRLDIKKTKMLGGWILGEMLRYRR